MNELKINLLPEHFNGKTAQIVRWEGFTVESFKYASGVCALNLINKRGKVTALPFQGMQIWEAVFDGINLKMNAMRKEPVVTNDYYEGFGAFFIHCGFTAMGVPSKDDSHPLHGELHHAHFNQAYLTFGEDERGKYAQLTGIYPYIIAFKHNCTEKPSIRLYENETMAVIGLEVKNNKNSPMEYMYMAHTNFRPVDYGEFVYSAVPTPDNVRVRTSIPPQMKAPAENIELMNKIAENPKEHHKLIPGQAYDPEIVMNIRYKADEAGWAHSMLIHPDGKAWYVKHRPSEFSHCMRWICRTKDQDAVGLAMPATAEPEGYLAEKLKGNIKVLGAGETVSFIMEAGMLNLEEAGRVKLAIDTILS